VVLLAAVACFRAGVLICRPERWDDIPDAAKAIPGLYAHTLTFLNGNPLHGNRACIGWKFALTEYVRLWLYNRVWYRLAHESIRCMFVSASAESRCFFTCSSGILNSRSIRRWSSRRKSSQSPFPNPVVCAPGTHDWHFLSRPACLRICGGMFRARLLFRVLRPFTDNFWSYCYRRHDALAPCPSFHTGHRDTASSPGPLSSRSPSSATRCPCSSARFLHEEVGKWEGRGRPVSPTAQPSVIICNLESACSKHARRHHRRS
jgi:hypothetical protein